MPSLPPATQALLLANVAVFFLERLLGGALFGPLALWPIGSGLFWPWQIASYSFLHGSFEHLFFNMLGLWMFGSELEHVWGQKRYCSSTRRASPPRLTQLVAPRCSAQRADHRRLGGLYGLRFTR
jgi:membrane associated rhomboid family serine protease